MPLRQLKRVLVFLVAFVSHAAFASDLSLNIRRIDGPGWRAENIEVQLQPPNLLQLRIAAVHAQGQPLLKNLTLICRELKSGTEARCARAELKAESAMFGPLAATLSFSYRDALHWQAALALKDLTVSEPGGRYASEKLSVQIGLRAQSERWTLSLETRNGQAYAEPVFLDFDVLPLKLEATLMKNAGGWAVEHFVSAFGKAGRLEASGQLDAGFRPIELKAQLQAQALAPLVVAAVQPFLIGSKLDGIAVDGRASAQLALSAGAVQNLSAQLDGVNFKAEKLGVSLDEVAGEVHWSPSSASDSRLKWSGGAVKKIALGASQLAFRTHGKDFELLEPWRQPLLEGALKVERLNLRGLGGAQLSADFTGALEPLDLSALCKALGWPQFSGTLGGRLPGLSVRDDVWTIDGALEAQLFDGDLRVSKLQAVQPFGVLPRVMADLEMRRLDLERLTRTFSFGRITGRLDGDVKNLRLLNWSPVAFDGRLYSTPDDDSKHRISQRAIDNISAIGGGPTGFLAHGFMSVFEDFAYDRLGISCVLRDGICAMDGVEPAGSAEGQKGYYLVKGEWLPRIDVVGYAQRVSWTNLLSQLKSAQSSGGPQLQQ